MARVIAAAVMALALAWPAAAAAQAQTAGSGASEGELTAIPSNAGQVAGRWSQAAMIIASARKAPELARILREHPQAYAQAYTRRLGGWQVSFFERRPGPDDEFALTIVEDRTAKVVEAWTGIRVKWAMARGYPGGFGRHAAALPVWLALLALFLLPFLRPPWRMLHLDLVVLASLSISLACFSDGNVEASVPLAFPPLVYLLLRLLIIARRAARSPAPPLRLAVGRDFLIVGIMFLVGARVGMQFADANVIDVGFGSVVGADKLSQGEALYGEFPVSIERGDTYGPAVYLAYLPFELLLPWSGTWDSLPAGHAAAATFDLVCAALLGFLGTRLRGGLFGLLMAYMWLAFPFTLFASNSGTNDALVGALILGVVALASRPVLQGATAMAAGLTKFAPLGLLPLFVRSRRTAIGAGLALLALLALIAVLDGGLGTFWDRTVGFQADRDSPFSIWGLYDLGLLQKIVQLGAVVLALAVAFAPHRDHPVVLASLAAAVLVAVQLAMPHWFYLYLVWVLPLVFLAFVGRYEVSADRSTGSMESARPGDEQRTSTALTQGSASAAP